MRIKQKIQDMKNERQIRKILKNYWKAHNNGVRFSDEYEDNISKLLDYRIKIFFQKKELAEKNALIRKMRYKCFYVDYLMAFVLTDKGQILYRGRFFKGLALSVKYRLEMLWLFVSGYYIRDNPYISTKGGIRCYFGLKKAMCKTGYPQGILLKSNEEILAEKNQK